MKKEDIIEAIALTHNLGYEEVEGILNSFLSVVKNAAADGEKVVLEGFGTFERKNRDERTAHSRIGKAIVNFEADF